MSRLLNNQGFKSNFCITFVCQAGELELKSLLLAASLRKFLSRDIEIIAAVPRPESVWGAPSSLTLDLMDRLGVRIAYIENPFNFEYPIGNKLAAIGVETSATATIFLDSDMLCMQHFDPEKVFTLPFSAKPADLATFGKDRSVWLELYDLAGCDFTESTVQTTFSKDTIAPYFNAGVVCVRNGSEFSKVWVDICRKIYSRQDINNKFPWLDQIGLPLAVTKLHYPIQCLNEAHNFPAHLRSLDSVNQPLLCHYHTASVIAREPLLKSLVNSLLVQYPELVRYFVENVNWKPLHDLIKRDKDNIDVKHVGTNSKRNFFITGIPRTGTSLLCSLLHKHKDCVVINEPSTIFAFLKESGDPWGVADYYKKLRENILAGESVENKIANNSLIEDTAKLDEREQYTPMVSSENFLLGTKNTLAYMARLPNIERIMPFAKTIACIRHPYQTIASWKRTFDHLRLADVRSFPVGNPSDEFLTQKQRQQLAQVDSSENAAEKRALLWRYLATILWDNKARLFIVHYESLISDTSQQLTTILDYVGADNPVWSSQLDKPLSLSDKSSVLTTEDLLAIKKICWPIASKFGYDQL
jgi:hypothetical protein